MIRKFPISRLVAAFLLLCSAFPTGAAVRGTAMDADGAPLAGASVTAWHVETWGERVARFASADPARKPVVSGVTDEKGNFSIEIKGETLVDLSIEKSGFAPFIELSNATEDIGPVILRKAKMRSGRVTSPEGPLEGVTVIAWSGDGLEILTKTDASGTYTLVDPDVWASSIVILHNDYALVRSDRTGIAKFTLDRRLDAGRPIEGRVLAEDGKTGAKAKLVIDGWPAGDTSDDGHFTITHAPSDWKEVEAYAGTRTGIMTRMGKNASIRLVRASSITGTVLDAVSSRPLANAIVTLGPAADRMRIRGLGGERRAIADARGAFTITGLRAGKYGVGAQYPEYSTDDAPTSVKTGESVRQSLNASPAAIVSGSIVDEDRKPVAAAAVRVARDARLGRGAMRLAFQETSPSGPDGRFLLRLYGEGEIAITATKRGFPSGRSSSIAFHPGERRGGVSITIPRGIEVTGIVTDRDGNPLDGVAVEASEATDGRPGQMRIMMRGGGDVSDDVTSRADGSFEMQLREGRYDIALSREGFARKRVRGVAVKPGVEPLEVSLEPGVEISGRIVRDDGAPVPDVDLILVSEGEQQPVKSGGDGGFVFDSLSPGPKMLIASKPDDFIQEMRNVTAPDSDVVIRLAPGGTVKGRVVEKGSSKPVSDFEAGLSGARRRGGMRMMTPSQTRSFHSEDGSFVLENVPVGAQNLVVRAAGFVTQDEKAVTVEEGKTVEVEVTLEAGVQLTGKVTGPDGRPLGGVRVALEQGDDDAPEFRAMTGAAGAAQTDGAGEYTIDSIAPGERQATFEKDGYLTERRAVKLTGKETRVDVRLSKGTRIEGIVVTESGAPVEGASVRAQSAVQGSGQIDTRTNDAGAFHFEGLTPGRYRFSASKSGLEDGEVRDIDISSGAPIRLIMKRGATISGRVMGLTEEEIGGVTVTARSSGSFASSGTDSTGAFRIEGAPSGTVVVTATAGSFAGRKTAPSKTVEVSVGGDVQVDLEFRSDLVVRGRVTRNGQIVDSAMVNFRPSDPRVRTSANARTDSRGEYEITTLEPGNYQVMVMDTSRFSTYETTHEVGGSTTFDIEMPTSTVRGRVTNAESGEPVEKATIQFEKSGGDTRGMFALSATSDERGEFTVDSIGPGAYRARAQANKFGQQILEVTVQEGDSNNVTFQLLANDGLTLRVVDARDGRALDAMLLVLDPLGRSAFEGQGRPRSDGSIRIPVAAGSYQIMVFADGYATRTFTGSSPGPEQRVGLTPGGTINIRSTKDTRQLGKLVGSDGRDVVRSFFRRTGEVAIEPGTTTLDRIAPGSFSLVVLDQAGGAAQTIPVTVNEGQVSTIDVR